MPTREAKTTSFAEIFDIPARMIRRTTIVYDRFRWPELFKVGEFEHAVFIEGWGDTPRERLENDRRLTALIEEHGGINAEDVREVPL